MGISPVHDSRNATGRFDSTVKALTNKKKRKELKEAAKEEFSQAKNNFVNQCLTKEWCSKFLKLFLMVAFYFVSSIALTFYQKQLIVHIPVPISIVVFHLVVKFCMAAACRAVYSCKSGETRVVLQWKKYISHVALAAAFSALDIGLSQWSFEYITISLYTMTKTTSIIFILIFAIFLKLEKKHWSQMVVVLFISIGLYLFTFRVTSFDGMGFGLAFTASFLSGARWTFSQKILQKSKLNLHNPIDFIYHIQPFMVLTILPLAIYVEGERLVASEFGFRFETFDIAVVNIIKIGVGGVMAFFMEMGEFLIISHASSLTLSIVGVVKEVMILILSIVIKGNKVSTINVIGMIICLMGLSAHVINKAIDECKQKRRNGAMEDGDEDDDDSDLDEFLALRTRGRSNFVNTSSKARGFVGSVPLLDDGDDSTSDDEDLRIVERSNSQRNGSGLQRNGGRFDKLSRQVDDSFYLMDQRQWTNVRDAHLEMKSMSEK